jgi:hypothetical protein
VDDVYIVHPFQDAPTGRPDDELSEEEDWFAERTRDPAPAPAVWPEHRRSA